MILNFFRSISVFLLLLVVGCATQPNIYHSEAELPYFHKFTKSSLELITSENSSEHLNFGIISAVDNDNLNYVLIAPAKQGVNATKLSNIILFHSVPLLYKQTKEFLNVLNQSAENWNNKFSNETGINYEYIVSSEEKIIPASENVVRWYPVLSFHYQNNSDGPLCVLTLGMGRLNYTFTIAKFDKLNEFISVLSKAYKE